MALPKIGLEAVFDTKAFKDGIKTYTTGLNDATKNTTSTASKIGSVLTATAKAGAVAFAALALAAVGAGVAIVKTLTDIIFSSARYADSISVMALVTGIGTERLQELAYAGKFLDVELEVITGSMKFLTRNMYAAREGTGETADAFKALGISVLDNNGNIRDANVVFGEAIDALGKIENPTLRDALAMKIMGKSAQELNPLIAAGSEELAKLSIEAHKMGAVMTDEGIQALDKFNDKWEALGLVWKSIKAQIALAVLPAFQSLEDMLGGFIANTLVPAIQHFGQFMSMLLGVTKAVKAEGTAVAAAALTQDNINWMWIQYWNGKGPRPPEGTEYTGGLGTAPSEGGRAQPPSRYPQAGTEAGFVKTPFEQMIENIYKALKDTDWTEVGTKISDFGKQLVDFGKQMGEVDWSKVGQSIVTITGWVVKFMDMIAWYMAGAPELMDAINKANEGLVNAFTSLGDALKAVWVKLLEGINSILTSLGLPTLGIPSFSGNKANPKYEGEAAGGDYYVTRPTLFLAGEAGPERAIFQPLNGGRNFAGGGTTVNLYATVNNGMDAREVAYMVASEIKRR